jgi:hypothetical protein
MNLKIPFLWMIQQFPQMECNYADPGDYTDTVSKIDTLLQRKKTSRWFQENEIS